MVNLPVAILAGGLGTRLRPLTESIPKVLVPVAGKPFLAHQLTLLRSQGVQRAVLCLGHLGDLVVKEFGDGRAWGMRLDYSFDGPDRLGTGGAIRRALPKLGDKFFVLNGDSYLRASMTPVIQFYERCGKLALMTVFRNDNLWDTGNVVFQNGQVLLFDKTAHTSEMVHIDYGLSLFRSSVFREWPDGSCFDMSEVNHKLIRRNELAGFEVAERFYEIGSFPGLSEFDALLRQTDATSSK